LAESRPGYMKKWYSPGRTATCGCDGR
jgi:hypothetical protein